MNLGYITEREYASIMEALKEALISNEYALPSPNRGKHNDLSWIYHHLGGRFGYPESPW